MIKIALIDIIDEKNTNDRENIGLGIITAVLREQNRLVDMFSFDSLEFSELITRERVFSEYQYIGFSIYPNTAEMVFRLINSIKSSDEKIIIFVGGFLATVAPAHILQDCPGIDFIALGNAEYALADAITAIDLGTPIDGLDGLYTKCTPGILSRFDSNINRKDIQPARDLLLESRKRGNFSARLNASFGCYGNCTFCSVNTFVKCEHTGWHGRNIDEVFKEILLLENKFGIKSFVINDASFEDPPGEVGKKRVAKLASLVARHERKLAFRFSMRTETFSQVDKELLLSISAAGFTHVFLGIEAGSHEDLRRYGKRATVTNNRDALLLFPSCGIDTSIGFIMLNPYSTIASVSENFQFLKEIGVSRLDLFTRKIDVYYGSGLHAMLAEDGLLSNKFSYRNVHEYIFSNEIIANIDKVLVPYRSDPFMLEHDGKVLQLDYLLSTLRALYGNETTNYYERYNVIKKQLADLLADHFEPILCEGNHADADRKFDSFKHNIGKIYDDLDSFILRLLYERRFRGFFIQVS